MLGLGHQHVEIGPGARDDRVELRIAAVEVDPLASHRAADLVRLAERFGDRALVFPRILDQAADLDHDRLFMPFVEVDVPSRASVPKLARRWIESQQGPPRDMVEPEVTKFEFAVGQSAHRLGAARRAARPADLEQVGEIGIEIEVDRNRPPDRPVTAQADALERRIVVEELEARHVHRFAVQPDPAPGGLKIGIGQVDDHRAIVVEQDRAQLERLRAAKPDREFA